MDEESRMLGSKVLLEEYFHTSFSLNLKERDIQGTWRTKLDMNFTYTATATHFQFLVGWRRSDLSGGKGKLSKRKSDLKSFLFLVSFV